MGKVSDSARIVSLKIVYFGAPGVGKSTNLERLRSRTTSEARPSDLIALDHEGDKTLMFDWTPVRAGSGAAYDVRLQVYAVPGKPKQESTKRRLLRDADGIVFILDSGPDKLGDNRAAWTELADHLQALGLSRDRVPLVIQLNKRDLPHAMNGDDLRARLGMGGFPTVEAVAKGSAGVGATLLDISRRAIRTLSDPTRTGGGEPLSSGEIARIESTALPEAFAASGLLTRRPKHNAAAAAEELPAVSSHRSHDSPRVPGATPSSGQAVSKEGRAEARRDMRGEPRISESRAESPGAPRGEHATQRLKPAALVALPRIESAANFTPAPMAERPERPGILLTPPSPGLDRAVPEEAASLPLIDAHAKPGTALAPTAAAPALAQPHHARQRHEHATRAAAISVDELFAEESEVRRAIPREGADAARSEPGREAPSSREPDGERPTLSPPKATGDDEAQLGIRASLGDEQREVRRLIAESEERVMARLSAVEEQLADLRGLLVGVSEQVRRVSTAPPESEERITKLVREALGEIQLSATLRAK